jgi:hypothetical protein
MIEVMRLEFMFACALLFLAALSDGTSAAMDLLSEVSSPSPSHGGLDLLGDCSSEEDSRALLPLHAPPPPAARKFGKGRHGTDVERRLLTAHMRECRITARRRSDAIEQARHRLNVYLAQLVPS